MKFTSLWGRVFLVEVLMNSEKREREKRHELWFESLWRDQRVKIRKKSFQCKRKKVISVMGNAICLTWKVLERKNWWRLKSSSDRISRVTWAKKIREIELQQEVRQVEWYCRAQSKSSNCAYICHVWETQILNYKMFLYLLVAFSYFFFWFKYFFSLFIVANTISNSCAFLKFGFFFFSLYSFLSTVTVCLFLLVVI